MAFSEKLLSNAISNGKANEVGRYIGQYLRLFCPHGDVPT